MSRKGQQCLSLVTAALGRLAANPKKQVCSFLWIYYGYPATDYEGVNVEEARYNEGREMGKRDYVDIDYVSAIPDSGIGMALGYSNVRKCRICVAW